MAKEASVLACVTSVSHYFTSRLFEMLTYISDVLNRFPKRDDKEQTIHIMMYIFPRQFGLHNAFTSKVDPRETAMPFKDYTLREKEIHGIMCKSLGQKSADAEDMSKWKLRIPKRLRGPTTTLIEKMRTLHHRCSYVEMLRHYCTIEVFDFSLSKPDHQLIYIGRPFVHKAGLEEQFHTGSQNCCQTSGKPSQRRR